MVKFMKLAAYISLVVVLGSHLAYGRGIPAAGSDLVSDGLAHEKKALFLEWGISAEAQCQQAYGVLPCSTNVVGLLFLIVVYELVLSFGGKYVGIGSNLFFEIIGPGVLGGSLFQLLGTIPQIVLVLSSALSGSQDAAQNRATLGMGIVAGTTVMLLTLIWGSCVVLGSYDLSTDVKLNEVHRITTKGMGIVTDAETSYTARIMVVTLLPFIVLLLATFFGTAGGRIIILVALIITVLLLFAFILYEIFEPWVQNRRFEFLMNKYAKDKLLKLLSKNGKPDTQKIKELFHSMDKNQSSYVSGSELRVLLFGLRIDDEDSDDLSAQRDVENILDAFDTSGDDQICEEEFIRGMTNVIYDLSDQAPDRIKRTGSKKTKENGNPDQIGRLASAKSMSKKAENRANQRATHSWLNILKATFYVLFGTFILCVFAEPLINSVVGLATATNLPSFCVSYVALPFAMNYGVAVASITSARQKTQKSISLTLSALYDGVYMNNIIGLIVFLAPVYARNLTSDVSLEVLVIVIICIIMTLWTIFATTFARWMGYLAISLYPISLAIVYLLNDVLGLA